MDDYNKIKNEILKTIYRNSNIIRARVPVEIDGRRKYFDVPGITIGHLKSSNKHVVKHKFIVGAILADLIENNYIVCCEPTYATIESIEIVREKDRFFALCENGQNIFDANYIILSINANKMSEVARIVHDYKLPMRALGLVKVIPNGFWLGIKHVVIKQSK